MTPILISWIALSLPIALIIARVIPPSEDGAGFIEGDAA